ncbi:unnamed protein product [Cuscuta epithymum]|uniref:TTF-type domain-containing protein n=1 Tax=Cuscuta epithymum TaxID=186058 RepID=A0AAV0DM58_9ASTE|nr:unnamed protein product [Cuscuta epithymum]
MVESGWDKLSRKRRLENAALSQKGAMEKFVFTKKKKSEGPSEDKNLGEKNDSANESEIVHNDQVMRSENLGVDNIGGEQPKNDSDRSNVVPPIVGPLVLDIYDPADWKNLDAKTIDIVIEKGPIRDMQLDYPLDAKGRHFSNAYYTRNMKNKESEDRPWLVYSKKVDKVFCFCCKLFKTKEGPSLLANEGSNDWKHLSEKLSSHEKSFLHFGYVQKWIDMKMRLAKGKTIDFAIQEKLAKEKQHWRDVLKRIIALVKTLAKKSIAFRGKSEKIYEENNGNFLAIIEMLAEFDPVMQEHLRRIQSKEIHYHYLSHKIQNELISKLASGVKSAIITQIKAAKYFSIILDCTPDSSHKEQMTLIVRCVDMSSNTPQVLEFFLEFIEVFDTSGLGLFTELESILALCELDIDDVRGQGYDNGSNMKGKHQGVQRRLLDINRRAFYMPCACHSLNLTISDMVNSCSRAITFFGCVQKLYTLFSGSTKRWAILKECVHGFTLKSLSTTRWECRLESVKAIATQTPQIREALIELGKDCPDYSSKSDVKSVLKQLEKFEFLLGMTIWYEVLRPINQVSKLLQSEDMCIDTCVMNMNDLIIHLNKYREEGFEAALNTATSIALDMGLEPGFPKKRLTRRKKYFDEDNEEDDEDKSPEDSFKCFYFNVVMDAALMSLQTRFDQMKEFQRIFGFLFSSRNLKSLVHDKLKECCEILADALQDGDKEDVDRDDLFQELKMLQNVLPDDKDTVIQILDFVKIMGCYPNTTIAYRILLTVPVTVATAERSFSKLKILKNYLRSTMSQERLNGLAILSIEHNVLEKLDYDAIVDDFASQCSARNVFK